MPSYISDSRLSKYEAAFCGANAGIISRFVTAPLDVVKIRMQLQAGGPNAIPSHRKYAHILPTIKTILREEGVRGLYKGNLAAEYLYLLYNAVEFCAYHEIEILIDKLDTTNQVPRTTKSFFGGMLAGSIATATTYPLDLLRTRFALQGDTKRQYTGLLQAVRLIVRTEGVGGLYMGLLPTVVQIMPYMGMVFATYDKFASAFRTARERGTLSESHKNIHDIASGALAGVLSKTVVYPMDVVRKRLQVQGPHRNNYVVQSIPEYSSRSWLVCIKMIVQQEGICSLYRGLTVALIKVAPAISMTFFVYEKTKNILLLAKGH